MSTQSKATFSKTSDEKPSQSKVSEKGKGSQPSEQMPDRKVMHSNLFDKNKSTLSKNSDKRSNADAGGPAQLGQRRPRRDRNAADTNQDRSTIFDAGGSHGRRGSVTGGVEYENTYRLGPDERISYSEITRLAEGVLEDDLTEVAYDTNRVKDLSHALVAKVTDRVRELGVERYKFVTTVTIGSLKERPALQISSRCLWNQATDTFATAQFENETLYAVATVFAVYQE